MQGLSRWSFARHYLAPDCDRSVFALLHGESSRSGYDAIADVTDKECYDVVVSVEQKMKNLDVFRQIIERGFNQGDLSVADEICSTSLAEHQYPIPTDLRGPDILKFQITSARAEMRGLILTIEDHVDDGKQLWVRLRATGTSPRSNQTISFDVIDICRFQYGKLIEHWGIPDRFALLHQSGALPPRPNH